MKERTPIKRAKQLQPLSRDHHHTLLLCWKIRKGFAKDIAPERIKKYADWFFENHILPHFVAEESYIFPILGSENELVKKALMEHRRLTRLFNEDEAERSLSLIEEELEKHIRFEERVLFNEIQQKASSEQLALISSLHEEHSFVDLKDDEFWK
ncbi:MAG: hemerythrin domain-containing protein [Imperialibacter sp.]|uniref:Hemerythrin domain-containing protein n=1 Tax=Imperialibacter roseus TaxID=1324217 RepID=A0ABZ0IXN3_9BACT|nr:hemerythrin domain-containing protein [Imperialibacter roseus]WOK09401.1 hemerythrin domain-containing protein [Imperialibacter roseus]